jgi:hypothetical protein
MKYCVLMFIGMCLAGCDNSPPRIDENSVVRVELLTTIENCNIYTFQKRGHHTIYWASCGHIMAK